MAYDQVTKSPATEQVLALYEAFDREYRVQFGLHDEYLSDLDLYPGEVKGALFVSSVINLNPNVRTYSDGTGNIRYDVNTQAEAVKLVKSARNLDLSVVMTFAEEKGPSFVSSNSILNKLLIETQIETDHGLNEIKKRIEPDYPWLTEISVLADSWQAEVLSHKDDDQLWLVAVSVTIRLQWFLTQFPDGRHYQLGASTAPIALAHPLI